MRWQPEYEGREQSCFGRKNAQDKEFNGEVHKWEQRLEYCMWKQRNWRYICCVGELEVRKSEKVRRKTCRVIRNRIRTARGKGPGGAFSDYTDLLSDWISQIYVQYLKICHTSYESYFLSKLCWANLVVVSVQREEWCAEESKGRLFF